MLLSASLHIHSLIIHSSEITVLRPRNITIKERHLPTFMKLTAYDNGFSILSPTRILETLKKYLPRPQPWRVLFSWSGWSQVLATVSKALQCVLGDDSNV